MNAFRTLVAAAVVLATSAMLFTGAPARADGVVAPDALPQGGKVVQGSASIARSGSTMTVSQGTPRAVVDWNSFQVGANASVDFVQPSAAAVLLNRVVGGEASQIFGSIRANGQVFLVNPNGVLFGPGAQVNVGGLVASTLDIANTDFMAGRLTFSGNAGASVVNAGHLTAADGGYVALLGGQVGNTGTISARRGTVALAAGRSMTLDFNGDGLLSVAVDAGTAQALATNGGLIVADGGQVLMTAKAVDVLAATVVNNTGVIEARGLAERGGRIVLDGGDDGVARAGGTLDASSAAAQGGSVIVTGKRVLVDDGALLDARGGTGGGEVLVGGGLHGGPAADGSAVRQAQAVTVMGGATLDASATDNGHGGTVAVWSDITDSASATRVFGRVLANGGPNGGDGGSIETSGHWLDITGARGGAAGATAGTWLLDPYNVTITTSAGSGGGFSSGTWTPSGSGSNVLNSDINTLLNNGTSVTITTGSSGTELGDITVGAAVTKSSGNSDVTFTLKAANSIVINSDITRTGGTGKLNLLFDADNDNNTRDGAGIVILNANLSTGGGFAQFGTGATMSINGTTTKVGGDLYIGGSSAQTVNTGGGAFTVNGETILANTSGLTLSTGGGNVTFGGLLNSGDSYALVTQSDISFGTAYGAAKGTTGGAAAVGDTYLATITSRLENAVASRAANYGSVWLGGRRGVTTGTATTVTTSDDDWRWVAGPEGAANGGNGLIFWTGAVGGTSVNGGYANWTTGEPNNAPGNPGTLINESAIQFTGSFGRWNDLSPTSAQTGVGGYLRESNLAASPLTINAGAGTVTFAGMVGGTKSLASLNVTAATVAINGGGVTTQGAQTYAGNVTLGSAATTLSQTNADTDFTLGSSRSITNASGGNASLTIATTGAIVLGTGSSITSSNGALTTLLDADSDASGSGYIWMQGNTSGAGATISSNGGAITLSGGTAPTTGYAQGATTGNGNGITLDTATLNSAGGNIVVRGRSATSSSNFACSENGGSCSNTDGIRMLGPITMNAGSGTISVTGVARGTDGSSSNGIETSPTLGYSRFLSSATSTTAISFYGDASGGTSTNGWGTFLWGGNSSGTLLAATGSGGGISINGIGRNGTTNGGGTHLEPNSYVLAASGPIALTGTKGSTSTYEDLVINSTVGFAASLPVGFGSSPVTSSSSDISITADSLSANRVFGSGSFSGSAVQSSGTLSIAPRTSGKAMAVQTSNPGGAAFWISPTALFGSSGLFKTGFTKLVFGSSSTGAVTLDNYSFDNDTNVNTGGAAVLGSVAIANHTLTVNVTGSGSITDTGAVAVSKLALNGASSAVTLDTTTNAIGTVAANVASLALTNGSALTVGAVGSLNGIAASGTVAINTLAGDLTVAQGIAAGSTGSSAVVLDAGVTAAAGTATGGNIVLSGSPTITVGSGGRATLMTGSVSGSTGLTALVGSGSGHFRYNSDEAATNYSTALGAGLYAVYREQPVLTVTAAGATKTYDQVAYSGGNGVSTSGYANGDTSSLLGGTLAYGGSAQGAVNANTYVITPSGYTNGLGYGFSYVNGSLVVNPITATLTGSRTYDGTTAIAAAALSVSNLLGGDSLALTGSGTLAAKGVGQRALTSLGTLALGGASSGNYTLAGATGAATIGALGITGAITAVGKTYDGTTSATTSGALTGVLNGDTVNFATSGSFATKTAGVGKTVNVTGSISGTDASNYTLTKNATTTATIDPLAITGAITAVGKTYDGTTSATTSGALTGVLNGDTVNFATSGSFATKTVGIGKTVNVTGSIGGIDSGNYTLTKNATTTATIDPLVITGAITASGKTYDSTTSATTSGALSGVLNGDSVNFATSGSFATKTAGVGKTVNVTGSISGTDASNYTLTKNATTTATIDPLAITGAITASGKTYDATTSATTSGTLTGVLNGDTVNFATNGSFATKTAGVGKTVNVTGSISGTDSGNYTLTKNATTTATIDPLAITGAITAVGKTYDGTTSATTSGMLSGVINGDTVNFATSGSFATKTVGIGKTVNVTGSISGTDASNYTLTKNATTTATIDPLAITGAITAVGKTYDGTTSATTSGTLSGVVNGDTVNFATSGSFATKAAGVGKTVNVTGSISGADSGNYTLTKNATATATIDPLAITGAITAVGKTYDGTTSATTSGALTGVLNGDTVSFATSGSFATKTAGVGKTVNVTGSIGGTDSGNYTLTKNATTTATIDPLAITGAITASGKTYDATTSATTSGTLSGVINGDTVNFATSGSFTTKTVGIGKTVNVSGSIGGPDSANYTLTNNATTTATIDSLAITGAITAVGKTYDGTTSATTSGALSGVVNGDTVNFATSGSFATKTAGIGKTVNVTGSISGADFGNYTLTKNATTTATIDPLGITGAITAVGKTYDGTTSATTSGTLTGVLNGDTVTFATSGSFATKTAGIGKTVNVNGLIGGTDSGNYTLTKNATTTATIDPLAITGAITAVGKTYDGTTSATTSGALTGVLNGDTVNFATSGSFTTKTVGIGKTVNVTGSISGTDSSNYTLTKNATTTATIDPLGITGAITAFGKTYDGTTSATTSGALTGVLNGDTVNFATSGSFTTKTVGTGKTVNVSGSIGGTDAGNYTLTKNATTMASIDPLAITGAITASGKTYDGTTSATTSGMLSGVLNGDTVDFATSGTFATKTAGVGKAVNVTGSISGADSANYTLTKNAATTATIDPLAITGAITAFGKTYDGTTSATTSGALTGVLNGDTVDFATSGTFATKTAGIGKAVNVTGSIGGTDSANYTLTNNATTTATIDPLAITGAITALDRTYDGTTSAVTSGTLTGVLGGDVVSFATRGSFVTRNAGIGKTVDVTGSLGGADAGNYALFANATTTATINPLTIAGVITASNKTYDGTTAATTSGALTGVLNGDVVRFVTSGSFTNKTAGTGKTVDVSGAIVGADAANYLFVGNATTTATITPLAITAVIAAFDKTYDGTTAATTSGSLGGVVNGDLVTVATTGRFADKNTGIGKTVTVTGSLGGADAGNYTLVNDATTTTATIAPAVVTAVTGIGAADKVYDGTTSATLVTTSAIFSGAVAGDALKVGSANGAFADRNAGMGKTVDIGDITLAGADAGNYVLARNVATTTATITPAPLVVTTHDAAKVADGSAYSGGNGVDYRGFVAGESATVLDGTVRYGGTAQGAVAPGSYVLSADGQTAANYAITWMSGLLTVAAPPPAAPPVAASGSTLSSVVAQPDLTPAPATRIAAAPTPSLTDIVPQLRSVTVATGVDGAGAAATVGTTIDQASGSESAEAGAAAQARSGEPGGQSSGGAASRPCGESGISLLSRADGKLLLCFQPR